MCVCVHECEGVCECKGVCVSECEGVCVRNMKIIFH